MIGPLYHTDLNNALPKKFLYVQSNFYIDLFCLSIKPCSFIGREVRRNNEIFSLDFFNVHLHSACFAKQFCYARLSFFISALTRLFEMLISRNPIFFHIKFRILGTLDGNHWIAKLPIIFVASIKNKKKTKNNEDLN